MAQKRSQITQPPTRSRLATSTTSSWRAKKYVRYGASPRGVQAIMRAAKIYALLDGRYHFVTDDIRRAAIPALRHRIILNFEGEAEGKTAEDILAEILGK